MELFWQASTIMVLGMGLVFLFLYVVILVVQLAAVLIRRYAPTEEESGAGTPKADEVDGDVLAAVIAAAVHERGR